MAGACCATIAASSARVKQCMAGDVSRKSGLLFRSMHPSCRIAQYLIALAKCPSISVKKARPWSARSKRHVDFFQHPLTRGDEKLFRQIKKATWVRAPKQHHGRWPAFVYPGRSCVFGSRAMPQSRPASPERFCNKHNCLNRHSSQRIAVLRVNPSRCAASAIATRSIAR